MSTGLEWLIDASGCQSAPLCNVGSLRALCDEIIAALSLHVVGRPVWHQFPGVLGGDGSSGAGPGGVTGMYLLSESHLTIHTFPELGAATLNLYCCRPKEHWNWEAALAEHLGATHVSVQSIVRGPTRTAPLDKRRMVTQEADR